MSQLTQLPTELRQQILLLVLPVTNRVETPANFVHLSHINKRIRQDMLTVTALWTPTHYISHPSSLTARTPYTRGYNLSRMCLDLFSTAFLGRIMWRFGDHNPANYTHPELLATWYCAVPFLDPGVRELWIDITPAPAEQRDRPQALLDVFVSEEFSARRFLNGHVKDVALLITRIDRHYEGRVRVRLTGRLSTKSLVFVKAIRSQLGRELEYEGTWVSADDARRARLGAVVAQETLCTLTRPGGRCAAHTLAWLSGVRWSMKTGIVYVKLAEKGLGYAVMQEVKKMGQLRVHIGGAKERVLMLPPADRLRRAFQHQVAADLGLQTAEADKRDNRYVIVRC